MELPHPEPIFGVQMQGSPLFDQYVTSYEVLYGDRPDSLNVVKGPDGKPKVGYSGVVVDGMNGLILRIVFFVMTFNKLMICR